MAAPVIDPRTSVWSMEVGRRFTFQPALTADSDPADEWSCDGLPDGGLCDVDTGFIDITAEYGGIGSVRLNAKNTAGTTTLVVPFGIAENPLQLLDSSAIEIVIDERTGTVLVPGTQPQDVVEKDGVTRRGPILFAKEGDQKVYAIQFQKDGVGQEADLAADSLQIALKRDADDIVLAESDGVWEQIGNGESTYYVIVFNLDQQKIRSVLSEVEDPEGTFFVALAEIRWSPKYKGPDDSSAKPRPQSSQTFTMWIEKGWIDPVDEEVSESSSSSSGSSSGGSSGSSASGTSISSTGSTTSSNSSAFSSSSVAPSSSSSAPSSSSA